METDKNKALVASTDIVTAEVLDQQEPIVVRGIFQFVVNKDNDAEKVKSMMQNFTEEIISAIDSFKRPPADRVLHLDLIPD